MVIAYWILKCKDTHTHAHTYIHTQTYIHTRTQTDIQTHTHTRVQFDPISYKDNHSHVPHCCVVSTLDVCFAIYPCVYACCIAYVCYGVWTDE
jgi:hypothetical protein